MYCTKCGKELPPSGICSCQTQPQSPYTGQNYTGGTGGYYPPQPPIGRPGLTPLQRAMRQFQGGVLFLIITIAYTLKLLLSFSQSFGSARALITSLLAMCPQILICIGLWLLFAASKGTPSTTGYTLASVGFIIRLVATIVFGAIGLIAVLIIFSALGITDYDGGGTVLAILVLVILVGCIINVVYLAALNKVSKSSKQVLQGQARELTVSMSPVVLLCIIALFQFIGFIVTMAAKQLIYYYLNQITMELYWAMGSSATQTVNQILSMLGLSSGVLPNIEKIINIATTVLCIVGLCQYRKLNEYAGSATPQPPYPYAGGGGQTPYSGGGQTPYSGGSQSPYGGGSQSPYGGGSQSPYGGNGGQNPYGGYGDQGGYQQPQNQNQNPYGNFAQDQDTYGGF